LNLGKYEAIKPSLTLTAELDSGDDPQASAAELHKMASPMWARQALKELSWGAQRRGEDKHEFTEATKGARAQLKSML
jgi:hypothetical protein